jgi:hypothetical protein
MTIKGKELQKFYKILPKPFVKGSYFIAFSSSSETILFDSLKRLQLFMLQESIQDFHAELEDFEMNSDSSLPCLNIEDISPGTVIMV